MMTIQIVVEPRADGGFVAKAGPPFDWTAEAATADEAVAMLRERAAGAKVVSLDVPDYLPPWLQYVGTANQIPAEIWSEYQRILRELRNQDELLPGETNQEPDTEVA